MSYLDPVEPLTRQEVARKYLHNFLMAVSVILFCAIVLMMNQRPDVTFVAALAIVFFGAAIPVYFKRIFFNFIPMLIEAIDQLTAENEELHRENSWHRASLGLAPDHANCELPSLGRHDDSTIDDDSTQPSIKL